MQWFVLHLMDHYLQQVPSWTFRVAVHACPYKSYRHVIYNGKEVFYNMKPASGSSTNLNTVQKVMQSVLVV